MARRTSVIWKPTNEEFAQMVKESNSMSELLRMFNLNNKGNNFKTCKKRITELGLNTEHFLNRVQSSSFQTSLTKEEFLWRLQNSYPMPRTRIKKWIIKFGIIKYQCSHCKNNGIWGGKKLVLQLEHIDGNSQNNQLENLTFLCPNCHSQTATFAGKRFKTVKKVAERKTKIDWPTNERLKELVNEKPMTTISKELGVSDRAIKKRCIKNGIITPKQGFFLKNRSSAE